MERCGRPGVRGAVSYTHLDVYKRQEGDPVVVSGYGGDMGFEGGMGGGMAMAGGDMAATADVAAG